MKKSLKNDLILIAVLLVVAAVAITVVIFSRSAGGYVEITENGTLLARYSLDENREERIQTAKGYNLLVITDGKAYIADADCPDKLCCSMRKAHYHGDTVVCLPHGLVLTVVGGDDDGVDVVV